MAIYHLTAKLIKRSNGQSAVACAAYRSGTRLLDERTGEQKDYRRKGGVEHSEILAPEGAPEWALDREQLWNRAEAAEKRKDAQPAREVEFALPRELDREQQLELTRDFLNEQFVSRGMVADFSLHDHPARPGSDLPNEGKPHVHAMLTMRELDAASESGFARTKNRDWNRKELLEQTRAAWALHTNRALERAGSKARIDHRSYQARGIDREAETKLGPAAASLERKGQPTERGDLRRAVQERNWQRQQRRQQMAQNYRAERAHKRQLDPVERLLAAQDGVRRYRRYQRNAKGLGEHLREARKQESRLRWGADQQRKRLAQAETDYNTALAGAFSDPLEARQRLDQLAALPDGLKDLKPAQMSSLKGWSLFGIKSRERLEAEQKLRVALQARQEVRQSAARLAEMEGKQRNAAYVAGKARASYHHARSLLGGDHREREKQRRYVFVERKKALRSVSERDILHSRLPEADKHELIDRMRKLPTKSQPVRDRPAYVRSAVPNVFSPVRPWDKPAARERDAERLDGAAGSQQQALTPEQQRIADEYLKRLAQDRARSERER